MLVLGAAAGVAAGGDQQRAALTLDPFAAGQRGSGQFGRVQVVVLLPGVGDALVANRHRRVDTPVIHSGVHALPHVITRRCPRG